MGADIKQRRLSEEEESEVTARAVSAYGRLLEMVNSFQYLARVILPADNDWLAVVRNLSWARGVWNSITRTLSREGEEPRMSGLFFITVVQGVLLFGLETWAVTPRMGRFLGGGSRTRWRNR